MTVFTQILNPSYFAGNQKFMSKYV